MGAGDGALVGEDYAPSAERCDAQYPRHRGRVRRRDRGVIVCRAHTASGISWHAHSASRHTNGGAGAGFALIRIRHQPNSTTMTQTMAASIQIMATPSRLLVRAGRAPLRPCL